MRIEALSSAVCAQVVGETSASNAVAIVWRKRIDRCCSRTRVLRRLDQTAGDQNDVHCDVTDRTKLNGTREDSPCRFMARDSGLRPLFSTRGAKSDHRRTARSNPFNSFDPVPSTYSSCLPRFDLQRGVPLSEFQCTIALIASAHDPCGAWRQYGRFDKRMT